MAAEIEQILSEFASPDREDGGLHGVAFIVKGRNDKTLYSGSAGKLNHVSDEPYTEDSVSWIASMSKLVTSIAALQVVEKGLVGLDDDLVQILPQFKTLQLLTGFDQNGEATFANRTYPLTLRHLLTHSSGFGYDSFDPDLIKWRSLNGNADASPHSLDSLNIPLKFQPGEGWLYGIGLDWIGHLIEVLTGLSLEEYVQKNIFKPLDLRSTTFRIADRNDLHHRRATISLRSGPQGQLSATENPQPDSKPLDSGGAGLHSTAADFSKVLSALLDGGRGILQESTVRAINQPELPDPKALEDNIFGPAQAIFAPEYPKGLSINHGLVGLLNLEDIPGKRKAGSLTWSGITNPRWWFDPESGIAGVLLVQLLPPGDSVGAELWDRLERAVYRNWSSS